MSLLFETVLIRKGIPKNLPWHELRMRRSTAALFGSPIQANLRERIIVPSELQKEELRCKITYNQEITDINFIPYEKKEISCLKLVTSDTADYSHKYTDRTLLDSLFLLRQECDDILIVRKGFLTDTTIANIIFTDGTRWFTPEQPLLRGTCRDRMLSEGSIIPQSIRVSDLHRFSGFKLINALRPAEEQEPIPVSNIR